jgi:hypothetical protein
MEASVAVPSDDRVSTDAFRNSDLAEIGNVYEDRRVKRELSLRGSRPTAGRPSAKGSNAKGEDGEDREEHDRIEGEELFCSYFIARVFALCRWAELDAWFLEP